MAAPKMNQQMALALAALEQEHRKVRERLVAKKEEVSSLEGEERGLARAIAQLRGEPMPTGAPLAPGPPNTAAVANPSLSRQPRGSVKSIVLRLTTQAGDEGLTVNDLLAAALRTGIELNRGSVSSLMSKMVRDKVFILEGDHYKAKGPFRPTVVEPDAA